MTEKCERLPIDPKHLFGLLVKSSLGNQLGNGISDLEVRVAERTRQLESTVDELRRKNEEVEALASMTARDLELAKEAKKFRKLMEIRKGYKWEWNAGAKYLYSELIRAYGLGNLCAGA